MLRDYEVITYYFSKLRSPQTNQVLLKQLDEYYFDC